MVENVRVITYGFVHVYFILVPSTISKINPFIVKVWDSNIQISTGVTLGWMTSSILEVLPNAVKDEWLSQTQADEIAQCFTDDDVELTYLIILDAPILFSSLLP